MQYLQTKKKVYLQRKNGRDKNITLYGFIVITDNQLFTKLNESKHYIYNNDLEPER